MKKQGRYLKNSGREKFLNNRNPIRGNYEAMLKGLDKILSKKQKKSQGY